MGTVTDENIKYITRRFEEVADNNRQITFDQFKKLYEPVNVSNVALDF